MEKTVAVSLYPIFSFFLFFEKKRDVHGDTP